MMTDNEEVGRNRRISTTEKVGDEDLSYVRSFRHDLNSYYDTTSTAVNHKGTWKKFKKIFSKNKTSQSTASSSTGSRASSICSESDRNAEQNSGLPAHKESRWKKLKTRFGKKVQGPTDYGTSSDDIADPRTELVWTRESEVAVSEEITEDFETSDELNNFLGGLPEIDAESSSSHLQQYSDVLHGQIHDNPLHVQESVVETTKPTPSLAGGRYDGESLDSTESAPAYDVKLTESILHLNQLNNKNMDMEERASSDDIVEALALPYNVNDLHSEIPQDEAGREARSLCNALHEFEPFPAIRKRPVVYKVDDQDEDYGNFPYGGHLSATMKHSNKGQGFKNSGNLNHHFLPQISEEKTFDVTEYLAANMEEIMRDSSRVDRSASNPMLFLLAVMAIIRYHVTAIFRCLINVFLGVLIFVLVMLENAHSEISALVFGTNLEIGSVPNSGETGTIKRAKTNYTKAFGKGVSTSLTADRYLKLNLEEGVEHQRTELVMEKGESDC